ncbi:MULTISPECIES: PP2C family protein-serine/threonine phosphatase [unclassified Minwuia]|jgi:serine phosphatase RsbU (regulator of sigma subunit)|uniref:PP2C family protein-serine/threonine phosphatase n=1 Tax=unclassified Minwuia TaxID=2618799 RepID=UPI00247AB589|nr:MULTISPECIES: PP2C family protein-serine/threonine phosphatase [unclassified Minwuia]
MVAPDQGQGNPGSLIQTDDQPDFPTLESELRLQQELAANRLTPGIVVVLLVFAGLGIGKYWVHIPLVGGVVWGSILLVLLSLPLYRLWRQRTGRALLFRGTAIGRASLIWAFAIGCHFAWAITFAMPNDDNVGRTTFAVMAFGLGGMTLASTYMIPRLTIAFLLPMIAAMLFGSLVSDQNVSPLQKVLMALGFTGTAGVAIRMNWLIFRSGVAAMVEREVHRLEVVQRRSEMAAASRIQRRLLPEPTDLSAGDARFDLAVAHRSAEEMTGDLYDFFMIDGHRLFFMVGDVCGKGVTSSLLMAMTKVMMKSAVLRHDRAIGDVAGEVSRELLREDHDNQFVTCFAGILDTATGTIDYCNAGHEPARIITTDSAAPTHSPRVGGPPLCAFEEVDYESGQIRLSPGATLLIVTDGVTEALNMQRDEFGGERLDLAIAATAHDVGVEAMLTGISGRVAEFVGDQDQSDDLTMLALRWNGPSA